MSRPGNWVFRNAVARGEIARYKVGIGAGCRNRNDKWVKILKHGKVRAEILDHIRGIEDHDIGVISLKNLSGPRIKAKCLCQVSQHIRARLWRHGRKIHYQKSPRLPHREESAKSGPKGHAIKLTISYVNEQVGRGERRMAAQLDFTTRSEPA